MIFRRGTPIGCMCAPTNAQKSNNLHKIHEQNTCIPSAKWSQLALPLGCHNTESNRARNTAKRNRVFVFSWFVIIIVGFLGSLIIPKWLINDSWSFLELPKNRQNLDPRTPYLLPEYFKQYKKIWEHPWNISFLHIWESEILRMLEGICT